MPASRSPNRSTSRASRASPAPPPRSRPYWPIAVIGVVALLAVIIAALPASIVTHFLPASVHAEDFSGSLWHGSAGKISVNARDAGALEWHLHPAALLGMAVNADLHWVKVGFVMDGAVIMDRRGITARAVRGSGPIEDLRDLGVAAGWRGTANVNLTELKSDFSALMAAVGDIQVSNLAAAQVADGADLGSYDLKLADGAVGADGNLAAQITDTGGPLEVQATIHYSAKEHTGLLTGTLKERADASPALRSQLQNLTQLRGRDSQGRIPVELEFSL
jgi:Type II secretion system (T2SS), protein N